MNDKAKPYQRMNDQAKPYYMATVNMGPERVFVQANDHEDAYERAKSCFRGHRSARVSLISGPDGEDEREVLGECEVCSRPVWSDGVHGEDYFSDDDGVRTCLDCYSKHDTLGAEFGYMRMPTPAVDGLVVYLMHRPTGPGSGTAHVVDLRGPTPAITLLPPRQDLANHSPDGFEWGYGGSGPAQLALAICAHALGDDERALRVYQRVRERAIDVVSIDSWSATRAQIGYVVREAEVELQLGLGSVPS